MTKGIQYTCTCGEVREIHLSRKQLEDISVPHPGLFYYIDTHNWKGTHKKHGEVIGIDPNLDIQKHFIQPEYDKVKSSKVDERSYIGKN